MFSSYEAHLFRLDGVSISVRNSLPPFTCRCVQALFPSNSIRHNINSSSIFFSAFKKDYDLIGHMCWWLEYPPVGDSSFEECLLDQTVEQLKDAMDGWSLRFILDNFAKQWRGARCKGREQRVYLRDVASALLNRFTVILDEIREVEGWMQKLKNTDQTRSMAIVSTFRHWRYQEITLIRSELWLQYHHSITDIYSRYRDKKLDWQLCWFESAIPTEFTDLIQQHMERSHIDMSTMDTEEQVTCSAETNDDSDASEDDYD